MYKISKKINDKWKTLGSIKKNKWDNLSLGLPCTSEFKKIVADIQDNEWLNLAVFPEEDKTKQ